MVKTKISDNKVLKIARFVEVLRIEYIDFEIGEAKIQLKLTHENIGLPQIMWVTISNKNKVTDSGIVINAKNLKPVKVKDREETPQEYKDRLKQMEKEGTKEFNFWWNNGKEHNLEYALQNGILLLDNLNYFDHA